MRRGMLTMDNGMHRMVTWYWVPGRSAVPPSNSVIRERSVLLVACCTAHSLTVSSLSANTSYVRSAIRSEKPNHKIEPKGILHQINCFPVRVGP